MNPKVLELKACIWSQIWNYAELLQLIANLKASHARVFRSMDVIVSTHAIPSISTLTEAKSKKQVWLEMDMYFDELMSISTNADLEIIAENIHQYVDGPATLMTMMHMLSDAMEAIVLF